MRTTSDALASFIVIERHVLLAGLIRRFLESGQNIAVRGAFEAQRHTTQPNPTMQLSQSHVPSTANRLRALTRIDDETRSRHGAADAQRLAVTEAPATAATYRRFLVRLYGFEAPVEAALHATPGMADIFDVRARLHTRLLRSDLAALGIVDLTRIPRSRAIPQFTDVSEALGWIYVIERGRMLSSILHGHLEQHLPSLAVTAASYLRAERSAGKRMRELGATFDSVMRSEADVDRALVAAHAAFRAQWHWYSEAELSGRGIS